MGAGLDETRQHLLPKNVSQETSIFRMIFLCMVVVSPGLLDGIMLTFSGIALPQMDLDIDGASWFGSIQAAGSIFSSIVGGLMIDKLGRRPTVLLAVIPTCLGWLLIGVGSNNTIIFTGRLLTGITSGITYFGPVYAAECIVVNHTHLRNHFNTWIMVSYTIGQLLCYILGYLLPYRQVAIVTGIIAAVICLAIFWYIPESPQWLHKRGRLREARHSERQLSIYQPVLNNACVLPTRSSTNLWSAGLKKDIQQLHRKDVYKPLCIMTVWLALIMFSGGVSMTSYMVDVLKTNSNKSLHWTPPFTNSYAPWWFGTPPEYGLAPEPDPQTSYLSEYQLSIVSGICGFVAVILMSSVITRTGVKLTFLSSTFCMIVALVAYGISEFEIEYWQVTLSFIHVVSVWVVIFFYNFGSITVATSVVGEMFPHDAKGFASVPIIGMCLVGAVAVKVHLYLYAYFGGLVFFMYAFVNLVNMIFTTVFVPETVGKTLDEITEAFLR